MSRCKEHPPRVYEVVNIYPDMPEEERERGKKELAQDIARILIKAKQDGKLHVAT